jgi:hypothetical protein
MNWFEDLTGISPDGGNGTFEALILGVAVLVICCVVWRLGFSTGGVRQRRFERHD